MTPLRSGLLGLTMLALGTAAGCGGDDTKTVTRTVTAPQPTTTDDFPAPPADTTPTTTQEPLPPATQTAPTTTDAAPSGESSQADAEDAARTASNDYTDSQYGISGSPDDWSATCTGEGDTFSCAVTFNGGQCAGRLTLTGPELTPGNERIGCGE